jgi:hypothetical protein
MMKRRGLKGEGEGEMKEARARVGKEDVIGTKEGLDVGW